MVGVIKNFRSFFVFQGSIPVYIFFTELQNAKSSFLVSKNAGNIKNKSSD
jgi:hypothetical protein